MGKDVNAVAGRSALQLIAIAGCVSRWVCLATRPCTQNAVGLWLGFVGHVPRPGLSYVSLCCLAPAPPSWRLGYPSLFRSFLCCSPLRFCVSSYSWMCSFCLFFPCLTKELTTKPETPNWCGTELSSTTASQQTLRQAT